MNSCDRSIIEGPVYVSWDCRPGDMISIYGKNARVANTYPDRVELRFNDGRCEHVGYETLHAARVEYVAMIVPVRPRTL